MIGLSLKQPMNLGRKKPMQYLKSFEVVSISGRQGAQLRPAVNKVCFLFIPARVKCQLLGPFERLEFFCADVQGAILLRGRIRMMFIDLVRL